MMLNKIKQRGQAITEFNVTAAFILVPLFIMIPLIGKYIDMKHSSVQAARYMAWERTVWFETRPVDTSAKTKSASQLALETKQRFFGDFNGEGLESKKAGLNPLWNDRGHQLLKDEKINIGFYNENEKSGNNRDVLNKKDKQTPSYSFIENSTKLVDSAANALIIAINAAISFLNDASGKLEAVGIKIPKIPEIDLPGLRGKLQFKGYYQSGSTMKLDNDLYKSVFATKTNPEPESPIFKSYAAVLTDSWVVEGDEQFSTWTKSLVPIAPFEEPFKVVKDVLTYKIGGFSLIPEIAGLELGYVDTDPVTDSSITPTDAQCPGGLCSFE